jgi:hypothetical protein
MRQEGRRFHNQVQEPVHPWELRTRTLAAASDDSSYPRMATDLAKAVPNAQRDSVFEDISEIFYSCDSSLPRL